MSERKSERDKKGRSVLVRCVVICIVAAFIGSLGIAVPGLAAQQTGDTVKVTVNAPEYVEGAFDSTIDVDSITDFNAAQFDLSFDSSVVNVTDVRDGEIDGIAVPVFDWSFLDTDTVRVLVKLSGVEGASGSGYLAEVEFEVKGGCSEKSTLNLSNGMLVNTEAKEIDAEWYGDEVTVLCPAVTVDAPEYVSGTFNAIIRIDNVTDLNSGQFDLSFDSNVVNVTEVKEGEIGGVAVPVFDWSFLDADTVRVLIKLSGVEGASGTGYLAEVEFEVKGGCSEKSTLDLSNGMLVDTKAKEIEAEWYGDEVTVLCPAVTVDAPEYVSGTFNAIIRIDNVTDLNSGQFDLSFDSNVANVTEVKEGEIDGVAVPVFDWSFLDTDTVRVLVKLSGVEGASGTGYLAEVEFEVKGGCSEKSTLVLSNGLLVNTEADEIEAEWYGDEVKVFCPVVSVDAQEHVEDTFNATIRIDNVTDLNSGQFDLSFDSNVVNVTEVKEGEIDGVAVPVFDWSFLDADTVRVLVKLSGVEGASGSGYLAEIAFEVKGEVGDKSTLDLSNGMLVDTEAKEIDAEWYGDEVTVVVPVFDTDEGTYPSIFGTHEGTITPSQDIPVQKMYTYPCAGTGGHSEYVKIWNTTGWSTEATWGGYIGDYHNIVFSEPFMLYAGETYNYIIETGSYPQIHHWDELEVEGGTIRCTKFTDANGKIYYDWIPAIKLW